MSRYTNSMHLPFAAKMEDFKMLREGVEIRNELAHLANELTAHAKEIAHAIAEDPKVKQEVDAHKKHDNPEHAAAPAAGEEHAAAPGEQKQNEGLGLGLALSSAAIIEYTGKIMIFLGNKFGDNEKNAVVKMGETLEHFGHGLHHKILDAIKFALKPVTFWMSDEARDKAAKVIFMVILAVKIAHGGLHFDDLMKGNELALGVIEKALTAIKVSEIVSTIKSILPSIFGLFKGGA